MARAQTHDYIEIRLGVVQDFGLVYRIAHNSLVTATSNMYSQISICDAADFADSTGDLEAMGTQHLRCSARFGR